MSSEVRVNPPCGGGVNNPDASITGSAATSTNCPTSVFSVTMAQTATRNLTVQPTASNIPSTATINSFTAKYTLSYAPFAVAATNPFSCLSTSGTGALGTRIVLTGHLPTDYTVTFSTDGSGAAWTYANAEASFFGLQSPSEAVDPRPTLTWSALVLTENFTLAAPTTTTGVASPVGLLIATLNCTVNAQGGNATYPSFVRFDYGPTISYGFSSGTSSAITGSADTNVALSISGLSPGTTYHYRSVASNADNAAVYGADATFTTPNADPVLMVI